MGQQYARVSIQGSLPGGEDWSVNPAFDAGLTPPTDDQFAIWGDNIRDGFAGSTSLLPQQVAQLLSGNGAITNIRVTRYAESGHVIWYHDSPLSTPVTGTGTITGPTTQALVVSLSAGLFARSGRGRLFWPAMRYPVDPSTGRFQQGALAGTLDQFKTMFVGIEQAAPSTLTPLLSVYSAKLGVPQHVTQLRLGDVMDSQRRRKDKLKETYAITTM